MQRKNINILFGVLLLVIALVVMAVGATAAQAKKWLLLKNKVSVASLDILGEVLPGRIVVQDLNLKISCVGGTTSSTVETSEEGLKLVDTTEVSLGGCDVVGAEKTCTVNSPGEPDGTIVFSGSGEGKMEGEDVVFTTASANLGEIEIQGLCAAAETEETVSGKLLRTLLNPLQDLVTHLVHFKGSPLLFGEDNAALEGKEGGEFLPGLLAHETVHPAGSTWAVHLLK